MAKSLGPILGILGIIVGACGLDIGIMMWVNTPKYWYDQVDVSYPSSSTRQALTGLSISATIGAGEVIYVSFTCTLRLDGSSCEFYIYIDNHATDAYASQTRFDVSGYYYYSIAIQYINNTLSAGVHTITVWALGNDAGNVAYNCVLFAQTV